MLIPRFANFTLDYRKHYAAAVKKADGLLEIVGIAPSFYRVLTMFGAPLLGSLS